MAYIGFSGLVGSQLGSLSRAAKAVEVLTTNGTTLAPGFFLFLAFVLASLLLSTVLENRIGEGHST
jgi:predicted exporter